MSAKLRDEIEAKRAKLQELRQARLARQKQDSERRAAVGCLLLREVPPIPTSPDTAQVPNTNRCQRTIELDSGS